MKIVDLGKPQKIGYYQIKLFNNCQFSIFANSLTATFKLQNPGPTIHSTLGILFHELIEGLNKIDDEAQKLEVAKEMINEKSDFLRSKPEYWWLEPLFSYSKTSVLLNKVVSLKKPKEDDSKYGNIESHFEYEVISQDNMLGGRIDKISISKTNEVVIHEFKSILEKNENDFISDHKEQILFYAGIMFENNSDYKISGLLYSADLLPHTINFSQLSAKDFIGRIRDQILEVIEKKVDYELLQKPSPENCLFCKLKPVCKSFINSQASFGNYEGLMLSGSVTSKSAISRLFGQIDLKTESGDRKIIVPIIHPFFSKCEIGLKFAFSDLSISRNKIEFTPRTVVYDLNK